jgi:hypothetical protein
VVIIVISLPPALWRRLCRERPGGLILKKQVTAANPFECIAFAAAVRELHHSDK